MQPAPLTHLSPRDVERLHYALGGDPRTEQMILQFIRHRWRANNLFHLPPNVAAEALRRPADFIRAARQHCEPQLPF